MVTGTIHFYLGATRIAQLIQTRGLSVVFIIVPGQSSIESMNHATLTRHSLCSDFECSHGTNLQFIRRVQRQIRQAQ